MCGENSCNVLLLLYRVLWVSISVMLLCRRAGLTLWHGFLFLDLLDFFLFSSLCLVVSAAFSCKNLFIAVWYEIVFAMGAIHLPPSTRYRGNALRCVFRRVPHAAISHCYVTPGGP
jgi:hypothetical protein